MNSTRPASELYEQAIKQWGYQAQVGMLHEELGELMQVLNKAWRKKATIPEIIDELANAQIMIEQISQYWGMEKVEARKIEKLARLEKLLFE